MNDPYVIGLHGGFMSADDMQRDMGRPSWVDWYASYRSPERIANRVPRSVGLVLVGYSEGGSIIAELADLLPNIIGAVLYESPVLKNIQPAGDFPVLWIRNDYRAIPYRDRVFADAKHRWEQDHMMYTLTGRGRHVRWRWGWPPVGHAWDQSLNINIANWIKAVSCDMR